MKPLLTLTLSTLLPLTAVLTAPASAEVLKLNGEVEVLKAVNAPTRGMTKAAVAKRFGKPVRKNPAVGKPPISSWEYPGYIVYFEGKYVLHTVANGEHGKPK